MKNKLFCMALSLSLFVLIGCDNSDDKAPQQTQTPAVLKGAIYSFEPKSTQWGAGKDIGVYMLKENTAEIVSPYDNVKYQTTIKPEGFFTPSVPENVLYYPADGSKVDIVAYYPLKEDMTDYLYPMNIASQNTSANFNFLYAKNGKGLSKDNQKKTLEMRPVLAQLNFRLVAGDGVKEANLTNSVAKVSGMNTTAKFNVLTGEFMQLGDEKVFTLNPMKQYNGDSCQVFPVTLASTNKLSLKLPNLGNMSKEFDLSTLTKEDGTLLTALEGGLRYNVSVTVGVEKAVIKLDGVEPIGSWTEGSTTNGSGIASPELLKNPIEWLSASELIATAGDGFTGPFENTWGLHLHAGYAMSARIQMDDNLRENVLSCNHTVGAASWYKAYVAYNFGKAETGIYTVRIIAKATSANKKIKVYMRNPKSLFIDNKARTGAKPYGGSVEFALTTDYQEYVGEFNFAKTVDGVDTYLEAKDAVQENWDKVYVAVTPSVLSTEFHIAEVSVTKNK